MSVPEETLATRIARAIGQRATRVLRMRRLVRAPIWLFRARLGAVFGQRMLLLEHIGRTSGLRRYVVLEVIDRPEPGVYIVASGFGMRAQWLRNVRANPAVRVWVGSHPPARATARQLTQQQAADTLTSYASRHPRRWDTFSALLESTLGTDDGEHYTALPLIALERNATAPPSEVR